MAINTEDRKKTEAKLKKTSERSQKIILELQYGRIAQNDAKGYPQVSTERHFHIAKPCKEEQENALLEQLKKIPLVISEEDDSFCNVFYETFSEDTCEVLYFTNEGEGAGSQSDFTTKIQSYYLPAGTCFQLALKAIERLFGSDKPLLSMDYNELLQMESDFAEKAPLNKNNIKRTFFALRHLPEICHTLTHDSYLRDIDKVNAKNKKAHVLSQADLALSLNDIALNPSVSWHLRDTYKFPLGNALSTIDSYPREIRCLTDFLYYSLMAFSIKDKRSHTKECSICGRLFFTNNAKERFCLYRYPGKGETLACRDAQDKVRSMDADRYRRKNNRLVEKIKENIQSRYDWEEDLAIFKSEYARFQKHAKTKGSIYKHQKHNEWLENYYEKLVSREEQ